MSSLREFAVGHRSPRPGTVCEPGVSTIAGRGRAVGRVTATVAATVTALTVTSAVQVSRARRRYGSATTQPMATDLLALPPDPTLADGRPIELLAVGDSGMAGVGVTDPTDALPSQIATRVAAHIGRPVHVVSHARAGARTHDVLSDPLAPGSGRPDVVVLLIGTNDVIHLTPLGQLADDTTKLLARLHLIGAPVVMCSLPEFGAMRAVPWLPRSAVALRAIAVRRIHRRAVLELAGAVDLVDVRAHVGPEFVHDATLMSADRFHPSAAGYSRIADALAPAVATAIAASPQPGFIRAQHRFAPGSAA